MTRKKQIIVPIAILGAGILLFVAFSSMKKPPEEKAKVDKTPIVAIENITMGPMVLTVDSYGVVNPKYETELVAQVSGQIVELADAFVRGGFVKQGDLLARIDPNDYRAALIDAQANLASAKASLEQELAQGKVAEREWKAITDSSPTALSLRKPQLAQELARVKAAEAAVLRAQRNLERTEILAPYDAMIESREIGLGAFVATGSRIGKVLGTAIAEVRLPVADNELQFLEAQGSEAEVTLQGEFAGRQQEWSAQVVRNEGVVDDRSRMSYFVAQIADPYGLTKQDSQHVPLRFGAYVKAQIKGISLANATMVPRHLVNNNQVAILDGDSTLHLADIEIIRQVGRNVIVASGLADGDKMIVSALDYPVEGMKLALPGDKPATDDTSAAPTQIASVKE